MNRKFIALLSIIIVIILLLYLGRLYILPNNKIEGNNDNYSWNPKPATGVRRNPAIQYEDGSNPSTSSPWPTIFHDMQRTGFVNKIGIGDIDNYGLLYHKWQDSFSHPVIADFDNNGNFEILSYSEVQQDSSYLSPSSQEIKMHSSNGQELWSFGGYEGEIWASPVIADINNDDVFEIIIPLWSKGSILVLDKDGNSIWDFQVENGKIESSPAVADINNDGTMEIVFGVNFIGNEPPSIYAIYDLNSEPRVLWEYKIEDISNKQKHTMAAPVIVDINKDNKLEIIVGSFNGYLYVLNGNGNLFWKFYTEDYESDFGGIYAPPTVSDLDGDGNLEIIFLSMNHEEYDKNKLYCIDSKGNKLWFYSLDKPGSSSGVSVADINNDGWKYCLVRMTEHFIIMI